MTQPTPPGPPYVPPTPDPRQDKPWMTRVATRHSGFAIAGFIMAIVGLFIAWIPVVGFFGAVGGVLGVVGMFRTHQDGEPRKIGLAIAAVAIGSFDLAAAIFWLIVFQSLRSMSCPHVYAYDGHDYRIDADPLAGSLFAAAESSDLDRLEYLKEVDGRYRIRVANDLQEVDHVDAVSLLVVDHADGEEVLPTQADKLLRVVGAQVATKATDGHGRDVTALVAKDEAEVFASVAGDFDPSAADEPQEQLILEFPRPSSDEAVLALRLHNTSFSVDAFTRYLAQMGPGLGPLLKSAQDSHSYPYQQRLADEMRRLGLMLDVEEWDGSAWVKRGSLRPIGPAVLREQAMQVALTPGSSSTVRLRLTMTPLFWEIDRARLSALSAPVQPMVLPPESCSPGGCADWRSIDTQRHVLYPGDGVELSFTPPPRQTDASRTVLVSIRGYYEVDVGGHGLMDPFAVVAHRRGTMSLPRFAMQLAKSR